MQGRFVRCAAVLIWLAAFCGFVASRDALAQDVHKIPLASAAVVHGTVIRLCELLPPKVPADLRERSQQVQLGQSPLPGSHRLISRADIARALAADPRLLHSLEIPASVDITRWSRELTREEVLRPISETLRANHLLGQENLTAKDVSFPVPVTVTEASPRLEVTRIDEIPGHAATRVRLWTPTEPRLAPFFVTIEHELEAKRTEVMEKDGHQPELVNASVSLPQQYAQRPTRADMPVFVEGAGKERENPVIVKPGQRVELIAQANGMRLSTPAVSLAAGRRGEKIRINVTLNGKMLLATVIDAQTVQIDY